jgi:GDP-D-mannose dehydratase
VANAQQNKPDVFVIATGIGATVEDFAKMSFEHRSLDLKIRCF